MKRILLLGMCLLATVAMNAQIMWAGELEDYAEEKYSDKWVETAEKLAPQLPLNKNNALTYTKVIEAKGKTKAQLYLLVTYWYACNFNAGKASILLTDKDAGLVIGKGDVSNIATYTAAANSYSVNLAPIVKTDIKDGKIRVTYTVPFYEVEKSVGGGLISAVGVKSTNVGERWTLDKCYPYSDKDLRKKTSAKALVMAHAYSDVIMEKIEEAVKNSDLTDGSENW